LENRMWHTTIVMALMLATLTTASVSQVTSYVDLDDDDDILSSKYVIWEKK